MAACGGSQVEAWVVPRKWVGADHAPWAQAGHFSSHLRSLLFLPKIIDRLVAFPVFANLVAVCVTVLLLLCQAIFVVQQVVNPSSAGVRAIDRT